MTTKYNIAFLALSLLAAGCHSHDDGHDHDSHSEQETHAAKEKEGHSSAKDKGHSPDEIVITEDKAKASGVKAEKVAPGTFNGVVRVTGKVLPASGEEATASATVAGIVSLNRSIAEGDQVGKGAPLFTISTSKLAEGDVTKRTSIALRTAKAEYERAEKLIADKLITQKEYEAAKSNYETARVASEAVGYSSSARGITIPAPISGYVKECLVKDGDFVNVGQPMLSVTQNRKLYLRAEVPEREYGSLGKINSAKFKASYSDEVYDLSALQGRMVATGKSTASTAMFVPVTFEFNNVGSLIPGSYADIYLLTTPRKGVITVPVGAITESQGVKSVYIKDSADCYRKQDVKTGETDGESVEILSGLKPGDNVVVEGAIQVKLASATSEIPAHSHSH